MIQTLFKTGRALLVAVVMCMPVASYATMPVVMLPDFSTLVTQVSPVVVNISTTKKIKVSANRQMLPEDMLRFFFQGPNQKLVPKQAPHSNSTREVHSLGSGFIISSNGYIVTNYHVVKGANDIMVKMQNRQEIKAKLIGFDKRADIALLKVKLKGLPVAKIGDSSKLKVGQWVLAIGEPFGLDYTVSHGIVSALGRALPNDNYVPFIQTDVPINPGNSGGPLINMNGQVVGINSEIYSKSGGSMGLSFSIPIDLVMNVVHQLKATGKVKRGYLGVQIQDVSHELAKSFGLKRNVGALVAEAMKGGAAAKAGVKAGDIILSFNRHQITRSSDLPPIVGLSPINKPISMVVLRNGQTRTVWVKLQSLDKADETEALSNGKGRINRILNAQVKNISPKILQQKGLQSGVMVTKVKPGLAQKMGILPGDILVTLNFKPINSVKDLNTALKYLPKGQAVPVRIVRHNRSIFLPLRIK